MARRRESRGGKNEGNFSIVQAGRDKCRQGEMAVDVQRKRHMGKISGGSSQQVLETDWGLREGGRLGR